MLSYERAERIYRSGEEVAIRFMLSQARKIRRLEERIKVLEEFVRESSLNQNRMCWGCFEKEREIEGLKEEIMRLRRKAGLRVRKEGYFGSSTPSSLLPFKENSREENVKKKGGARAGHKGHGRKRHRDSVDAVEEIRLERCPECRGKLEHKGFKERSVTELKTIVEKKLYRLERGYCRRCKKYFTARPPSVLPKHLYGNNLISSCLVMHYLNGMPLRKVSEVYGIGEGSLIHTFHKIGDLLKPFIRKIEEIYRKSHVRHADETGWRIDGRNGYAWVFGCKDATIFRFRPTRSSKVPEEIFGDRKLRGYLVVDRYNAYNRLPVKIQYCYEHLKREVQDTGKSFPEDVEVQEFTGRLTSLLNEAILLSSAEISDREYYKRAKEIKKGIEELTNASFNHPAVRRIQDIFYENSSRCYHWVKDRRVPPHNNFAERELRPTVIARKVSFGSQSEKGAKTREILMTILYTIKKHTQDPKEKIKELLDMIAEGKEKEASAFFSSTLAHPP